MDMIDVNKRCHETNKHEIISLTLFVTCLMFAVTQCAVSRPNIVFILTDDQDVWLGSLAPMQKAKKLIGDNGITFTNAFASTPICCPSRSTILTGLYLHNHGVVNNSLYNCSSARWQQGPEKRAFITYLKKQNYSTFYAGKYLNQYGFRKSGGVKHIPPGWDYWYGLVGNSRYYNYTLSANGKREDHGDDPKKDYLTDVISRRAVRYLRAYDPSSGPFFMMLATPAAHAPFTPAPKYANKFSQLKAPRTKNFNVSSTPTKHWLLRQTHYLKDYVVDKIDDIYRNRWRTLLSVDDLVEKVITTLDERNLLRNTYVFLTSDHGYHLGQFSLPLDKRQLYETDIRIPLMVRGPNVPKKKISNSIVVTTDIAPTFLEIARIVPPKFMDGTSFADVLKGYKSTKTTKTAFLIEYVGEGKKKPVPGCPTLAQGGVANCFPDCVCEDSFNNTYSCVRLINPQENKIYCEFLDGEHFVEAYDLNSDPYQLKNLAFTRGCQHCSVHGKQMAMMLRKLQSCIGRKECHITH